MVEMDVDMMKLPGELGVRDVRPESDKDRQALQKSILSNPYLVRDYFFFNSFLGEEWHRMLYGHPANCSYGSQESPGRC